MIKRIFKLMKYFNVRLLYTFCFKFSRQKKKKKKKNKKKKKKKKKKVICETRTPHLLNSTVKVINH